MSSPMYEHSPERDAESGYASGSSSEAGLPDVFFSKPHLKFINQQLQKLEPEEILKWCLISLPSLYQTTAFGLTGLVTVDMLSKISGPVQSQVDLIFFDTLYHFSETLSLVDRVRRRYPHLALHVYKPQGIETTEELETKYGLKLWETNDELYDWVAKVEPAQRAYAELQVKAVLTGRRRSQGGKRGDLDIIEVDEQDVQKYIQDNDVPYNELFDRGYKSVGDWHPTQPIKEGEDERAGRWKGQAKTECGIHNKRSRYAQFLQEQEKKKKAEALSQALESGLRIEA
ncbi:Phosphoadenosine phosphosulfate reductase [Cryomyces minteri]|uniref:Phosphoadenosine phosphosulfate reductase n=1 Tax=Cryomyces minteri TaxID=331657 RepID=A0A4U0X6P6_9PEZI|nr:Phosphoadenosine phosphosulfate reductase [Cryomyces minteri]TKA76564.1 Phosphoadenosine phosphosulfate reductase [Cryomyces minteri]